MDFRRLADSELNAILQCLRSGRERAATAGHDVSRVSIGADPCERTAVLVADDSGCLEFGVSAATGRFLAIHNGAPSRALESSCLTCRQFAEQWQLPPVRQ